VPHGGWIYTFKLLLAGEKKREQIKKESLALVKNRHFIYEDVTAFAIQQGLLENKPAYRKIREALKIGLPAFSDSRTVDTDTLVSRITNFSSLHAPFVDKQVVARFDSKMTQDPSYDLELDHSFSIRKLMEPLDRPLADQFLQEVIKDHELAGTASRSLLLNALPQ